MNVSLEQREQTECLGNSFSCAKITEVWMPSVMIMFFDKIGPSSSMSRQIPA